MKPVKPVAMTMRVGPNSDAQMTSFQNATLHGEGKVAFSIATYVEVPEDIKDDVEKTAAFLKKVLTKVIAVHTEISFEVEVGEDLR